MEEGADCSQQGFQFNKLVQLVREVVQLFQIHADRAADWENTETKSLMVKIPKGVDDGSRIRLSGEGEAGLTGGSRGTCIYL